MKSKKLPKNKKAAVKAEFSFRERRFGDIDFKNLKHPVLPKGFTQTLPGPPGWQYKLDPGK